MTRIDIPKTQSVMAVIFTPITGAIAIAVISFNYITSISHWILGCFAFAGALLGVEAVGGACCYALIKCHREKNYGADFFTALAGAGAYIAGGILTLYLQSPIVIFFILSPFGYFAYSIIRTMADEITAKTEETNAQTELIKAQTRLTNAETRKAKAQVGLEGERKGLPEIAGNHRDDLPEGLSRIPVSLDDFRRMVESGEALPEQLTGDILAQHINITDRTGRNWLAAVKRNGHNETP